MGLSYQQRVETPDGLVGYVDARIVGTQRYLVTFRRSEFPQEQWLAMSPLSGPTVSKEYEFETLKAIAGPARIVNPYRPTSSSWTQVVSTAEQVMKKRPSSTQMGAGDLQRLLEAVTKGSIWKSRRGGYHYKVYDIRIEKAYLQGVDNSDLRELQMTKLVKTYDRLSDSFEELGEDLQRELTSKKSSSKTSPTVAPRTTSTDVAAAKLVVVGSLWSSRRNGDVYEVIIIEGESAKLSWTKGAYTRVVALDAIIRYYTPVEKTE